MSLAQDSVGSFPVRSVRGADWACDHVRQDTQRHIRQGLTDHGLGFAIDGDGVHHLLDGHQLWRLGSVDVAQAPDSVFYVALLV